VRFYQYAVSQRDYDNDGIENGLDPCPSDPNPGWDPRVPNNLSGGDGDADGLPDECDPSVGPNNDEDGDGWQNRIDNCPTVPNSDVGGGGGTTPNTFQYDRDVPPGEDVPVRHGRQQLRRLPFANANWRQRPLPRDCSSCHDMHRRPDLRLFVQRRQRRRRRGQRH
jgi:hypothetical protein